MALCKNEIVKAVHPSSGSMTYISICKKKRKQCNMCNKKVKAESK